MIQIQGEAAGHSLKNKHKNNGSILFIASYAFTWYNKENDTKIFATAIPSAEYFNIQFKKAGYSQIH